MKLCMKNVGLMYFLGVLDTFDEGTRRHLEILRNQRDTGATNARLDAVDELVRRPALRSDVRGALKSIADLPRLIGRIGHASASPSDLVALPFSLDRLPG